MGDGEAQGRNHRAFHAEACNFGVAALQSSSLGPLCFLDDADAAAASLVGQKPHVRAWRMRAWRVDQMRFT